MNSNRWRIEGVLETTSPLHIGDGDARPFKYVKNGKTFEADIATVSKDANGVAYIPGSTLKGCVRGWLERNHIGRTTVETVFGWRSADAEGSSGAKAEFGDSFYVSDSYRDANSREWDASRKTCVAPGVTIDRVTKTAADEHLYYAEYVPAGVRFEVKVTIRDVACDDEVALLLAGLEAINRADGVQLGAGTGDGQGRLRWSSPHLFRTNRIKDWLSGRVDHPWEEVEADKLLRCAQDLLRIAKPPEHYKIRLRLWFESNFLVNDPSQKRSEGDPDHAPIRQNGEVVLPGSSVRGAFRSQAEKIVRTLIKDAAKRPGRNAAKQADAVHRMSDVPGLPLVSKVFGAAGWTAPVGFSAFTPSKEVSTAPGTPLSQEFIAVDRFTGGGADGKKFRSESYYRPVLDGCMTMDADALRRAGVLEEGIGLIALTSRDLIEGDVPLGLGASKGYGAVRAEILGITGPAGEVPIDNMSYVTTCVERLERALSEKSHA